MSYRLERSPTDDIPMTSSVMKVFKQLTDSQLLELVKLMARERLVSVEDLVHRREATRGRMSKVIEGIGALLGRHSTEDQRLSDIVLPLRNHIEGLVLNVVVNGNNPHSRSKLDSFAVRVITDFIEVAAESMPSADYTKRLEEHNSRRP